MTAYTLLENVAKAISATWADRFQASVVIADDPAHALQLLTAGSPRGCVVVIFYVSDTLAGDDFVEDTLLSARLRIGVVKGTGMQLRDGKKPPAVLSVVDSLRAFIGSQEFEGLMDLDLVYNGMQYIPTADGKAMHGYALTYAPLYSYDIEET